MRRVLAGFAAAFLIGSVALVSVVHADKRPASPSRYFQVTPQAIPTVNTAISALVGTTGIPPAGTDLYVCQLSITVAPGSAAINITIGSNPSGGTQYFWNAVPLTPTSTTGVNAGLIAGTMPDGCLYFPGGMFISASATGASISALSGRY
jgi:hypothetical protein